MQLLQKINDPTLSGAARLAALREYAADHKSPVAMTGESNNHIHTIYSFSPYTPAMAALKARDAGLDVAGSVDHDSIGAAGEMLDACQILGLGGVVGFEVRVSFKDGPFADRKINNPDSQGYVYMTVQGIPRAAFGKVDRFLQPIRAARQARTRQMTADINVILQEAGFRTLDFERDVLSRSQQAEGGGLTERHLLAAVATILIEKCGKGESLIAALRQKFGLTVPATVAAWLADAENPHYLFDVLGLLKSTLLDRVFIQPDESESIPAIQVIRFADEIGAIPAYAYLGDVGESPTGDKKAEKFEDDFIEPLFEELCRMGYRAIAYMPPRNTVEQLRRVQALCAQHGLMEISGVDINSSRQSFNCRELLRPEFRHLNDTTWALVAHQALVSVDPALGIFAAGGALAELPLAERLARYAELGRALDCRDIAGSISGVIEKIKGV